jgi:hypothetical protein
LYWDRRRWRGHVLVGDCTGTDGGGAAMFCSVMALEKTTRCYQHVAEHTNMCTPACAHQHVHTDTCIPTRAHRHVHTNMCTPACAHRHVHTSMCTPTCAYQHVHTRVLRIATISFILPKLCTYLRNPAVFRRTSGRNSGSGKKVAFLWVSRKHWTGDCLVLKLSILCVWLV